MAEVTPLRKNKQFQLLWLGSTFSEVGSELTRLAMPLMVLALTGSPGWAGIVAGARAAAVILFQLPAGVWVDRWDRRRTLILSQGFQAAGAAGLAALITVDQVQIWHFILFGVIDGVCFAFAGPARTTAIRGVVPATQLRIAFTQEESRTHAAGLIGPPLGGLLFGLGRALPFVVDAITFLIAMLCTVFAKVPRRPVVDQHDQDHKSDQGAPGDRDPVDQSDRGRESGDRTVPSDLGGRPVASAPSGGEAPGKRAKRSMRREAGEAVGWLWCQRGLREISAAVMVLNLLGGAFLLPLIVLVGERGGDAFNTGTVLAGTGIGGLIGALLSDRIGRLLPPGKLLLTVVSIFGAALAAMALPLGPWWPMIPLMLITLSTPSLNVVMSVAITRLVPEGMLGRIDAVLTVTNMGLKPLAPVLGGTLATLLGGAPSLILLGVFLLLTAATAALSHELRHFTGEPPTGDEPPTDNVPANVPADGDPAHEPSGRRR